MFFTVHQNSYLSSEKLAGNKFKQIAKRMRCDSSFLRTVSTAGQFF